MVFVSSGRDGHTQSQVYSFDIVNKKLSRVTYSDGLVFRPLFFPNGESLIYSSSTDEDKEHPDLTKLTDKNPTSSALAEMDLLLGKSFPGFEIYIRRIRGDSIQRVQRAAGYDLAEDIDKTGKRILVSSHRGDKTDISLIDINGNLIRHFNSYKGVYLPSPRFVPQVSLTKKMLPDEIIWVRLNSDQTKDIVVTDKTDKEPKKLVAKNGQHASLAVSPDGKSFAFSSNFLDSVNYDIFIAKMDGSCLERVTMDPAEDLFPSFSPDGQKMLITSKRGGHFDVYLVDLNTESNPTCIP